MAKAILSVESVGPVVSVQDAGRRGLMRFGVPGSGPLDRRSFFAANIALGNPISHPAIEVSLGGVTLECRKGSVSFAVAGGGFVVEQSEVKRHSWTVATLKANDRLTIRPGLWGSWCYLAFAGSMQVTQWLGSASTHAISGFGGGCLAKGTEIVIDDAEKRESREGVIAFPVSARPRHQVRVTLGPQQRFFSEAHLQSFVTDVWKMTDARDRMGARLSGPSLTPVAKLDMPSEPISRGSVQVAGDGVASVLLADHQTTGGYPKIATMLDCDIDSFVQLRPRDHISFRSVSPSEAISVSRLIADIDRRYFHALARSYEHS
jgi:biotin-dependent carboxylase-like uncharacterized protein